MKLPVFLSWGGARSRSIAELLHTYLPQVIQVAQPWMSQRDIAAGAQWPIKLAEALKDSGYGLLVLTKEALQSHFVTFEAAALWKALPDNHVCPLLFDGIKPADVGWPLAIFQMKSGTDRSAMLSVMQSINAGLKSEALDPKVLEPAFARVWPELEAAIHAVPQDPIPTAGPPVTPAADRTGADKLDELLTLVRAIDRRYSASIAGIEKGAFSSPIEAYLRDNAAQHSAVDELVLEELKRRRALQLLQPGGPLDSLFSAAKAPASDSLFSPSKPAAGDSLFSPSKNRDQSPPPKA